MKCQKDTLANQQLISDCRMAAKGVWKKILSCAIKSAHSSSKINLQKISVDSSSIPAKKGEM
ncbi:MAG: hypothetical protein IIB02_08725 [Thaumarchaeota archaeon]|nr:hypothetical protein [Nitrososphaerota archaeon]